MYTTSIHLVECTKIRWLSLAANRMEFTKLQDLICSRYSSLYLSLVYQTGVHMFSSGAVLRLQVFTCQPVSFSLAPKFPLICFDFMVVSHSLNNYFKYRTIGGIYFNSSTILNVIFRHFPMTDRQVPALGDVLLDTQIGVLCCFLVVFSNLLYSTLNVH